MSALGRSSFPSPPFLSYLGASAVAKMGISLIALLNIRAADAAVRKSFLRANLTSVAWSAQYSFMDSRVAVRKVLSFWDNLISEFHVYQCRVDPIRCKIHVLRDPRRALRETASDRPDWNSSLLCSFRGVFGRIGAQADRCVHEYRAKTSNRDHTLCQVRAGEDAREPRCEASLRGSWLPGCKSAGIKECADHHRSLRRFSMSRVQEFL